MRLPARPRGSIPAREARGRGAATYLGLFGFLCLLLFASCATAPPRDSAQAKGGQAAEGVPGSPSPPLALPVLPPPPPSPPASPPPASPTPASPTPAKPAPSPAPPQSPAQAAVPGSGGPTRPPEVAPPPPQKPELPAPSSQPPPASAIPPAPAPTVPPPPDAVSAAAAMPAPSPATPGMPTQGSATPGPASAGTAASPAATPPSPMPRNSLPGAAAAETQSPYLRRALAELESAPLPGGGRILVKRSPGSDRAAAVIALPGLLDREGRAEGGLAALALALAAEGSSASVPGELARLLRDSGASLSLAELEGRELGLLLEAAKTELPGLLTLLDLALADPAFLREAFPQARVEALLRELRLAERLRARDPAEKARSHLGLTPSRLGTEEGFRGLSLAKARAFWTRGPIRREILVLGDIEAAGLAARFATPDARRPAASLAGTEERALPLPNPLLGLSRSSRKGYELLLAFRAPPARDREAAALLVGLELLEELAGRELAQTFGERSERLAAFFLEGGGLGLVGISGSRSKEARKALGSTLEFFAAGPAARASAGKPLQSGADLEAAKTRALAEAYGERGRAELALALAAEMARGGDGSAFYRFEGLIATIRLEDAEAALRKWLAPEGLLWMDETF